MIVAENASIDFQGAFVSLFRKGPLLTACVSLCKVVQQGRNVGRWGGRVFKNIQGAVIEFLRVGELTLLVPELAQSPKGAAGFLAACAMLYLRQTQRLLQRRLGTAEIAGTRTRAAKLQQRADA